MEYLKHWLLLWLYMFFTIPALLLAACLIGIFCYSFILWQWDPWMHPVETLKMLNPLAHTWSRVVLLVWTFLTGIASNGLSRLG